MTGGRAAAGAAGAAGLRRRAADPRPVLFVTNHAPAFRVPAFARLHAREGVDFALVGGDVRHGGGGTAAEAFAALPSARTVPERAVLRLAGSGGYRAVVAGLSGRVALPAAYLGARRARVPFVLWATIWAHPRTPAHVLSYLPLRCLYADADAIVTYGPHVSAYVRRKGARSPVFEAAQAVDGDYWGQPGDPDRRAPYQALFVGRMTREKGVALLVGAWRESGIPGPPHAALVLAGGGRFRAPAVASGVVAVGPRSRCDLRNLYGGSDVLVLPSIPTPSFREPWGLVANEAMHQGLPVIATDAVGAAAGGLVADGRTGLVVPAGDRAALATALRRLHDDPELRRRLGAGAREAVRAYSFDAWADGVVRGLAAVGAARSAPGALLA